LAVDAAGAVYVADSGSNPVLKLVPGAGTATALSFPGLNGPPGGIAVDAAGDVYVADTRVLRLTPGTGAPTVLPFAGLNGPPKGLAVDAAGAVYVTDAGNSRVVKLPPA
jgi:sugar lactone lactonase YvrE